MNRVDVTEKIITTRIIRRISWAEVAQKVGLSKESVTAANLAQMAMSSEQATIVGGLFDLSEEEPLWLTTVPYKGSLPTDPLIYRF